MPNGLTVTTTRPDDRTVVIATRGEIDLLTVSDIKRVIADELADEAVKNLVVDLTDTVFIDSTGLGLLLGTQRRLRESGGQLAVVNDNDAVAMTFAITGLDQVLDIYSTREQALAPRS